MYKNHINKKHLSILIPKDGNPQMNMFYPGYDDS